MLGFIKKDLLMIKSNIKVLVILLFIYIVMIFQNQMDLSFLLPFMSLILMLPTFSYDSYNNWNAYAVTMPNGRKNNVKGKYMSTIILICITTIVITVLSIIITYIKTNMIDFENIIGTIIGNLFATILLLSVIYPAMYKFGPEKARIGLMIIVFCIILLVTFVANYIDLSPIVKTLDFIEIYWFIVLPAVMILMLYLSYKISEIIYVKKEM